MKVTITVRGGSPSAQEPEAGRVMSGRAEAGMCAQLKTMEAEILEALYFYGPLEYYQISYYLARRGYPRKDITVFDSLAKLVRMGAISHISPWASGSRKQSRVYYLQMGREPRRLLEAVLQDAILREFWWPATEPYRLRRKGCDLDDYLGHFLSDHERVLRNFKLQVATSGEGLEFWRNDAFKFHRYRSATRTMVRPDALFSWRFDDPLYRRQPFYYFVELELSWKSDERVRQRARSYIDFLLSLTWKKTKSGLELSYFPAVLFLFPEKEGTTARTAQANMHRHHKALLDVMAAIERDLARWEQSFSCGFSCAGLCAGVLDKGSTDSPVHDAIWYDLYRWEQGPCTLRDIVPSAVKEKLEGR